MTMRNPEADMAMLTVLATEAPNTCRNSLIENLLYLCQEVLPYYIQEVQRNRVNQANTVHNALMNQAFLKLETSEHA